MEYSLGMTCALKRLGSVLAIIAFFTFLGFALTPLKAQGQQYYRIDFNNYKSDSKALMELGAELLAGNEKEGWAEFRITDPQIANALKKQTGWIVKAISKDALSTGVMLSSN